MFDYVRLVENCYFVNFDYPIVYEDLLTEVKLFESKSRTKHNNYPKNYLPVNIFHALSCHADGLKYLEQENIISSLLKLLNSKILVEQKAALWSLSSICISNDGCYLVDFNNNFVSYVSYLRVTSDNASTVIQGL